MGKHGYYRTNKHDVDDGLVCSDSEVCPPNGNLYGEGNHDSLISPLDSRVPHFQKCFEF